jgi:hypothetical protein
MVVDWFPSILEQKMSAPRPKIWESADIGREGKLNQRRCGESLVFDSSDRHSLELAETL